MEKRDSLVNLLMGTSEEPMHHPKPPSTPKPQVKPGLRTRRASSVSSPYKTPRKAANRASPGTLQGHKKPKTIDLTAVDFSGKNVLDLRDEVTRISVSLRDARSENEELKHDIARLKKVIDRKEKEVEDLLVGGYVGQRDRSRIAGASTKQDALLALSSLKHRVHILERNLRLKEEELSTLRRDVKTTRLKELQTEKEVYYSEIQRLQVIVDSLKSELNDEVPQSKKFMKNKIEEQSRQIKKMKERSSTMATDLSNLKVQMGFWRKGKPIIDEHETDERKYLFSKYSKMSQGELISKLMDSETKLQDVESKLQLLEEESKIKKQAYQATLEGNKQEISHLSKNIDDLESRLHNVQDENKNLTENCTQYKELVEKARQDLSDTTEKLNTLRVDKETMFNSLREEEEEKAQRKKQEEAQHNMSAAGINSKKDQHKQETSRHKQFMSQKHTAATVIQKTWKHHLSDKKQKAFEREHERVARAIQSVMRSHKARTDLIHQEADTTTITILQNIFRGHRTRELFKCTS